MRIYAVILAGGSGTRLWPASRRARPKQLLALANDGEPMIMGAIKLARKIAGDRVMIVTSEALAAITQTVVARAEAPGSFRDVEVIAEPAARNTAAAIGLAAALIIERDPSATIVVLPADQYVQDPDALAAAIDVCAIATVQCDAIALVGIPPTRAETGFGYLEMAPGPSDELREVLRFVEKPDRTTAEGYVSSGHYLWNAGIFCLTARRLLAELDTHLPETGKAVRKIARSSSPVLDPDGLYEALPSISFDHAVMEKTDRVAAIPAAVGWNDVGSWAALPDVRGAAEDGNTVVGQGLVIDGSGNVVLSDDDTLVVAIGVSDLAIVKHGDAILVIRKDQAQRVREVTAALEARRLDHYL